MSEIIGKRHDFSDGDILQPGEYGKYAVDGQWYFNPPNIDGLGCLAKHTVAEHEDGTITVSPSILITVPHTDRQWHGYLVAGVWREV